MTDKNPSFHRLEILTGAKGLKSLDQAKIIVFGVGGVGSYCAEALVRSGIGTITLVDSDVVCVTNINRQVQALRSTVGKSKVELLAARLRDINPDATITPMQTVFNRSLAPSFLLENYHYAIDAIDSLSNKVDLIIAAHAAGAKVYTALGASNKLDPLQIRIASLWDSQGCPLGRYVRKRLRRKGFNGEVTCVYSEENLPLHDVQSSCGTGQCLCPKSVIDEDGDTADAHEWCSKKKQINGSVVHITGTYGFFLAGCVIQDILKQCARNESNPPES